METGEPSCNLDSESSVIPFPSKSGGRDSNPRPRAWEAPPPMFRRRPAKLATVRLRVSLRSWNTRVHPTTRRSVRRGAAKSEIIDTGRTQLRVGAPGALERTHRVLACPSLVVETSGLGSQVLPAVRSARVSRVRRGHSRRPGRGFPPTPRRRGGDRLHSRAGRDARRFLRPSRVR